MWNRAKVFLSSPFASVICFITALLGKIVLLKMYLTIGADKMGQIVMTRNMLQGHGIRLLAASPTDIGSSSYVLDNGWPPGYNFLLGLFLDASGFNYVVAAFITDCIAALLFFWFCRKMLLLIDFPAWSVNLFLLFQAFFLFKYLEKDPVTDFLSLSLLVAALYQAVKVVKKNTVSYRTIAWFSFFLLAASSMRYQNFPACLMLAGCLTLIGWFQKQKSWSISGAMAACFLITCFGSFLLYQHFQTGKAYYLLQVRNGFFPSNLLYMDPYVATSFVNVHFFAVQFSLMKITSYRKVIEIVNLTALPLFVFFTVGAGWHVIKKRFRINNAREAFFLLGFIIYLSIVLLLVLLSLRLDINIGPPLFRWTYVMNSRYYAFPIFFVQVCAWWFFFVRPTQLTWWWQPLIKYCFIGWISFEGLHGFYYAAKHCNRTLTVFHDVAGDAPDQQFLMRFIKEKQAQDTGRKIVVTSYYTRIRFLADLYGASALLTPESINHKLPVSSTQAVLLAVIREKELPLFGGFLGQPGVKLLSKVKDFYFYTYYVEPSGAKP